ncbi:hypothetical protein BJ170DRAFT_635942 [Xylariales sp. AK1849]|nr:hypothetical protein BJ170DRAFT_635942 [Xylariales sp. AK1849]
MRYSRFRSAMLGLEPQRRNRTIKDSPNRVTKSKKGPKAKKDDSLKSESAADSASIANSSEPPTPKIKQESAQPTYDNRLTPASMATTPSTTVPHVIQPRMLTPCSDTDAFGTSQGLTSSPASEMINSQTSFDFPPPHYGHDLAHWHQAAMFPSFNTSYEFEDFGMGCGHQHMQHHGEVPPSAHTTGEAGEEHVNVKHENWDNHCV